MDHVAILKKKWKLTSKILSGEKTIESRWYKTKRDPWNKIKKGETVYLKDSGDPVIAKAEVLRVIQVPDLNNSKLIKLLEKHHQSLGIETDKISEYAKQFSDKNYCILIYLKNPVRIEPFFIDKTGYGLMSAWLCVENITEVKK
ncbi:ASCH domain-containing protein [Candidatus Woesearchaeota archaeon]|jgi:hypothetical protein|nr:ASCH domain-containing protein [Candidatus Woesearchaeota archaeon]